jgi:cytochrome c biogenesis factor
MDQKDYFQLGVKLIGLYSLVLALPVLLGILPTVIAVAGKSTKVSEQFGVQHLPLFASPILMATLGFYLLKSRAFADRICFNGINNVSSLKLPEYFTVGTKLYGVLLVVGTIPGFLKLLANFLFALNHLSPHADTLTGETGLRINFLPDLAMIGFGILLLLKGEIVTSWAFPSSEENDTGDR